MSEELKKCREQIDSIDEQLLQLVSRRAQLAHTIGNLKNGGPIYRPEREAQVLRRLLDQNPGPLSGEAVTAIFRTVMSNCRALEKELSVAFLGPLGTFSEEAANKQFGGLSKPVQCASIDEVFQTVETGAVDYGVVPVENSTEGGIGRTLDLLLLTSLYICGEIALPVHHNLLSKASDKSGVTKLYSHAQSLAQCHEWLNRNLPGIERQAVASNSEAARLAAIEPGAAAIASRRAGELFGLNLLAENIEDDPRNTTRFLVLSNHDVAPSGKDKTSLAMAARNVPGAVVSLLEPLARHDVSMTKFESRPAHTGLWEYVFFVDIEGHREDARVAAALQEVDDRAAFLKVMGSYPVAVI
ncbi:chorismate mutase [Methylobacillus sp. MM3]|jgi:chorismate mutase/prephenate dehydratase|uniref:prephenate dehydratase n=1 Tax=Methylobacillus sp. MM3 TaxID=1848039 RepID=UPI0007E23922|nr:prephenate dehydratase [Methylobacillus sp. MM3]OAJ71184.1 chorismate mutase [Methylobacillus sp. MM3]